MTAPSDPTGPATSDSAAPANPPAPAAGGPEEKKKPWAWIAIAGLLAIVAIGLGVWAAGLSSDLDDQKAAATKAQTDAAAAQEQADAAASQANALTEQVNALGDAVSDAGDQLSEAGGNARTNTQKALKDLEQRINDLIEGARGAAADQAAEQQAETTP